MKIKLLILLLGLMGMFSCNDDSETQLDPIITYQISGKVTNENGNPIPGISVSIPSASEAVTTSDTGTYTISGRQDISTPVKITFIDKDGSENTGSYITGRFEFTFTDADRNENNECVKTVDISLERRKDRP